MRALLQANGFAVNSLRPGRSGLEHHLFYVKLADGRLCVAKIARQDYQDSHWPDRDPTQALAAECQAIARVQSKVADFPMVPQPYHLLAGDPPGALMGLVPGQPPEVTLIRHGMDVRSLRMICAEMGRMLAEIHRVHRPGDPGAIPDLPGAACDDPRLLHMDFHLGNVLGHFQLGLGWKLVGIVDWTCAHWGPREADLAELGASLFATNPDLLDDFLVGYRQRSGVFLSRPRVLQVLITELERRLRDEPPQDPKIYNRYVARIEGWSGQV